MPCRLFLVLVLVIEKIEFVKPVVKRIEDENKDTTTSQSEVPH
jgi:hypothetical protein